ncbi:unnamed protein product, partial [Laminaria digitata]
AVVQKTAVSSNMRFVFAVGLEGAGHHYFAEVLDHLFDVNKDLVRISGRDNVNRVFYTINNSMGYNAEHYRETLTGARENMRNLARRGAALKFPGTVVSMFGRFTLLSYPSGRGPNKALKYFDLRKLAEVAEAEGVDLRLLYLRRPAKELMIADIIHRHFENGLNNEGQSTREENFMQYVQVMFTDIAVVHSFLMELGPEFAICHDFDRFGDVDQSAVIANFLAPNERVAAMLNDSLVEVAGGGHAKPDESLPYEGADEVVTSLQRKLDAFESNICSGVR